MSRNVLSADACRRALSLRDLTDPSAGPHAMQLLLDDVARALARAWGSAVVVHRDSPVVTIEDNYDRLHYPPDGAARDARYTRYVTETTLLRTQSTAMIPPLLRRLAQHPPDDVLLVCPGLVYRRDTIDRLHTGEPHQVDLWRIRRGAPLDGADLRVMIATVVTALLPGRASAPASAPAPASASASAPAPAPAPASASASASAPAPAPWRCTPAVHPYTTEGLQIDVDAAGEWVEIGECGLALGAILGAAGLDPARWSGLAMGLGLDRLLMLRKGIDDIRLLRAEDPRIAGQMLDLAPYRPVSTMPPVRRDLSIAVPDDDTPEELGDRVRTALGDDADCVELVEVVSETPQSALPPVAAARLGMRPGQKNVLLRVVLRHPERTLTHAEANGLRDEIYAALHRGTVWHWASGGPPDRPAGALTP